MKGRLVALVGVLLLASAPALAARKKAGAARPATAARARAAKVRLVAILPFGGPLGNAGRGAIFVGLRKRPELSMVPLAQTDAALKLLNPEPTSAADFQSAAGALDAAALLQGAANKKMLIVRVYSGDTGTMLIQQTFPLKNGNMRSVVAAAWPKLRKAILASRATPPPASTPAAAPPLPPRPTSSAVTPPVSPDRPSTRTAPPPPTSSEPSPGTQDLAASTAPSATSARKAVWLDVAVYGGAFRRNFTYTDDLFKSLSYYKLNGAPTVGGKADIFPFAPFAEGFAGNFGLVGRYETAVGLKSVTNDGTQTFNTVANDLEGGLKLRLPFLASSEASLAVTYEAQTFSFGGTATSVATVPNVAYKALHGELAGRLGIGAVSILGGAGYSQVFSSGEIASTTYFPHLKVGGVEGTLGAAYAFSELFEARLQGTYRHYFYSMNPKVGDTNVAGGALDQYIAGTVSLAARLR